MGLRLIRDMMGRELQVPQIPQRIVSIVPSQTELLFDLGLEKEVVGITKFCVHPNEWHKHKTRIGGTKKLHIDKIIALQPDLVIANKEENTQAEIEQLAEQFPVWISDIKTIDDALRMIEEIGMLVGKEKNAVSIKNEIEKGFSGLIKETKALRVAYFIWRKPWMSAGADTFIHDMIKCIGWQNVYASHLRYPETSLQELSSLNPEIILLSSEPYPFSEKHIAEIQSELPEAKILLVDGEMFSWYGSRMKLAAEYLQELIKGIS